MSLFDNVFRSNWIPIISVQRLEVRVKQRVPLRESKEITSGSSQAQELVIGDHLCEHHIYLRNYSDEYFSVLQKARCKINLLFFLPCANRED